MFILEGDTSTFLYLISNGLGSPEHPDWGSWGGRYLPVDRSPVSAYNHFHDATDRVVDSSYLKLQTRHFSCRTLIHARSICLHPDRERYWSGNQQVGIPGCLLCAVRIRRGLGCIVFFMPE
ncbi:hypothetical protein CA14_010151 [Aspergillus flavus]|uniref:Cellulose-binding Sde182 nucleoside hydrolase-like domain-containing protein n=1 Tax=Aspergillus flavus TaxID=5059 RepID=A0AB74BZB8_ASPFL|nr:hypothetical protein CA14_010151 [Aspergillus flavus]